MENENKCNKYEGLFVFRNEEELNEHLKECPECREEHEKQQKVSALIKEVAPVYLNKKHQEKSLLIKKFACCFILFAAISSVAGYKMYEDYNYQASLSDDSYIQMMGLPTDEYGFFEI